MQREKKHEWKRTITAPTKPNFCDCCGSSRNVTRLDGVRGKKQVWRPHVRTWGLSEANVLYWRKYLWHCWDFMAPSQWFGTPILIKRRANCAPLAPSLRPCIGGSIFIMVNVNLHYIVSSMESISKISSLPSPGKVFADARASDLNFFNFLAFSQRVLVVSYLQANKKSLNYRNFNKPYLCNIQSLETWNLRDRDETWNFRDRDRDSQKMGLETPSLVTVCLPTSTFPSVDVHISSGYILLFGSWCTQWTQPKFWNFATGLGLCKYWRKFIFG